MDYEKHCHMQLAKKGSINSDATPNLPRGSQSRMKEQLKAWEAKHPHPLTFRNFRPKTSSK